jgi:putative peptide zinc metalloprotease protein
MTVSVEPGALVPGPGGFATSLASPFEADLGASFEDSGYRDAGFEDTGFEDAGFEDAGFEDIGRSAREEGARLGGPDHPPRHPPPIPNFPVPRLSAGLRLHGEYQGSGFTEPKYIARRGDGQVVQLSRLLHLVADAIDGASDTESISHRVSGLYGREVSEENIAYLVEQKLTPLGVTVPYDQVGDEAVEAPRSDLLLALKGHRVLFDQRRVERIGRALSWLHRPLMVGLVLAGMTALDVWLFGYYGAMTPVLEVLDQPVLLLAVFALTVASLVFHEFGHASACRYGGARPGCIGCGLFLIWPSMYTDVTDVYRIGRAGRIRTDLGGVYFNVVFMLGMAGCYFLTGQQFFLSAVYLGHFEVLEQLMPAVRLDGYYILGDLAGVPDLFGKIRPILLSAIPGRPVQPEAADLKRSARVIVTVWVLTMVPLLLGDLGYALWNLPRILATGIRSLSTQLSGTASAFADGHVAGGLVGVLGSLMLICPLGGMAYLSIRLGGRLLRTALRGTSGSPRLRAAFCGLALAGITALSCAWINGITPAPLPAQPPIVPVLQPGVPTAEPPQSRPPTRPRPSAVQRTSSPPTTRPSSVPVPVAGLTPAATAAASPPVQPQNPPPTQPTGGAASSGAPVVPPASPSGSVRPSSPSSSAPATPSPSPSTPATPQPSTTPSASGAPASPGTTAKPS